MKNITQTVELEEHLGNFSPKDPWSFGKSIERQQEFARLKAGTHTILFNKGRYFETSIYNKKVLNEVSELTGIKIQYNNMIVASWKQMEDFVIAMNCLGIAVLINIDWI